MKKMRTEIAEAIGLKILDKKYRPRAAHHSIIASWSYDAEFNEWTFRLDIIIPGYFRLSRSYTGPSKKVVMEECEHDNFAGLVESAAKSAWNDGKSNSKRYTITNDEQACGSSG